MVEDLRRVSVHEHEGGLGEVSQLVQRGRVIDEAHCTDTQHSLEREESWEMSLDVKIYHLQINWPAYIFQ